MIRRSQDIPASLAELPDPEPCFRDDILPRAWHGMRDVNAPQKCYLSSILRFHGWKVGGGQRLQRMDDVDAGRQNIGHQPGDGTVAVQHDLRTRIEFAYGVHKPL